MELIWNEQNQNAVVHEVRSDSPEITLPETVEGRKIVAVGAYCFSDRKRKETNQNGITTVMGEPCDHSAQGEFVEKITLPDAVERIENAAFFNCKKLYALEVGKRTTEIGSDVFNNCSALHKVRIRGRRERRRAQSSCLQEFHGMSRCSLTMRFCFIPSIMRDMIRSRRRTFLA